MNTCDNVKFASKGYRMDLYRQAGTKKRRLHVDRRRMRELYTVLQNILRQPNERHRLPVVAIDYLKPEDVRRYHDPQEDGVQPTMKQLKTKFLNVMEHDESKTAGVIRLRLYPPGHDLQYMSIVIGRNSMTLYAFSGEEKNVVNVIDDDISPGFIQPNEKSTRRMEDFAIFGKQRGTIHKFDETRAYAGSIDRILATCLRSIKHILNIRDDDDVFYRLYNYRDRLHIQCQPLPLPRYPRGRPRLGTRRMSRQERWHERSRPLRRRLQEAYRRFRRIYDRVQLVERDVIRRGRRTTIRYLRVIHKEKYVHVSLTIYPKGHILALLDWVYPSNANLVNIRRRHAAFFQKLLRHIHFAMMDFNDLDVATMRRVLQWARQQ